MPTETGITLTHDQLQAKCFEYGWNTYPQVRPLFFATFNEVPKFKGESGKAHMIRIMRLRSLGLVPGVLDLILIFGGKVFAFDIKVGKDKLSDYQLDFCKAVTKNGGNTFTVGDFDYFKSLFDAIILNNSGK